MDKLKNYLHWEDESEVKSVFSGPVWEHIKNMKEQHYKPRKYKYSDFIPRPFMPNKLEWERIKLADKLS